MTDEDLRRWVEDRSIAHAALWLLERDDLRTPDQYAPYFGIHLAIVIGRGGRFRGRYFGGVVKACRSRNSAPKPLTPRAIAAERERFTDATFPVCMLAFSATSSAGWFRWIVEPVLEDGSASLRLSSSPRFRRATDELRDQLIDDVNRWFEARTLST